jgi:hypothetical protein
MLSTSDITTALGAFLREEPYAVFASSFLDRFKR